MWTILTRIQSDVFFQCSFPTNQSTVASQRIHRKTKLSFPSVSVFTLSHTTNQSEIHIEYTQTNECKQSIQVVRVSNLVSVFFSIPFCSETFDKFLTTPPPSHLVLLLLFVFRFSSGCQIFSYRRESDGTEERGRLARKRLEKKINRTGRKFTIRFRILLPPFFVLNGTKAPTKRRTNKRANEANFDVSPDCENIILICATPRPPPLPQNDSQQLRLRLTSSVKFRSVSFCSLCLHFR